MSSGVVQIFTIEKGEFIPTKFKPDKHGNSVVCLDYANDDEYLAAVYDSTDICLFGLKTGVKTDSFKLDGSSTLIRFHPVKKFALAIASYQGAVTMFDVQSKKKIFFEKTAHSAPTRDIAMFSSSQDVFVSCGYDCKVNIYDLRKRTMVQQHIQPHPMSAICVSTCGTFCVGGNLKGDVISYDFRNMKEPLDSKRAHDSAVVRIAFIPAVGDSSTTMFGQTVNSTASTVGTPKSENPSGCGMDSFAKFVDVYRKDDNFGTGNESKANVHDSWADMLPTKQKHNFSNISATDSPSRMSIDSMNRSELRLKRPSRLSVNHSIASEISDGRSSGGSDVFGAKLENFIEEIESGSPKKPRLPDIALDKTPLSNRGKSNIPIMSPDAKIFGDAFSKHLNSKTSTPSIEQIQNRRSRSSIIKKDKQDLHGITEEVNEIDSIDKENCQSNGQVQLSTRASSSNGNETDVVKIDAAELKDVIRQQMQSLEANLMTQMDQMSDQIIDYVDHRVHEAESDACFQRELYFNKDFTNRFESTQQLEHNMQTIEEGLAALLHVETVKEKFTQYQTEIVELRKHL